MHIIEIEDEIVKDEILKNFEKGEVSRMTSGLSLWFEEERTKSEKIGKKIGEKKSRIEIAKSLLDVLDVDIIAKKFDMTVEEVEALKVD